MPDAAVVVFTRKPVDEIRGVGGSASWVLNPDRVRRCEYVVCVRNQRGGGSTRRTTEPHGTAFLIGRVVGVVPHPRHVGTGWLIRMDEYAALKKPNAWNGQRNPVRYATLEELGIDTSLLRFVPI